MLQLRKRWNIIESQERLSVMYKNKYLIGIYAPVEQGETLLRLCESVSEFAHVLGISMNNAYSILNRLWTGEHKYIRFERMCCGVEFIDDSED